jgi:hypothetical protein
LIQQGGGGCRERERESGLLVLEQKVYRVLTAAGTVASGISRAALPEENSDVKF